MDLFDTLTFAEILGRTTFLGTLSLTVLTHNKLIVASTMALIVILKVSLLPSPYSRFDSN
jgi:hypothetical protein